MSEIKLAGTLKISRQEALNMIADYFKVFPGIKRTLDFLGEFGVRNGYIQTFSPFFRKRWFPFWYEHRGYIEAHVSGIKYHPTLGEIERASKNMPFQGGGGDMVKMAVILIRNYTKEHNLWNKIKLNMQVHDQITCSAIADYASEWKDIMDRLMCKAADIIVTTGILKADTNISSCWTK
jgi:DNA polymerase-1